MAIVHMTEHLEGPPPGPMGCFFDQRITEDALMCMPNPILADTPYYAFAKQAQEGQEHRDVFFWELEQRVIGQILRAHMQYFGTCVSQGFARGVQFSSLADMVFRNQGEEWVARVHPGSIYGISRVEIGQRRIRGDDGSYGAWAARGVVEYGVLFRLKYGKWDLTGDGDEVFSRDWGRKGVPDELEPTMREHPIADASLITTGEQLLVAAYDYRPVVLCSQQGFTTRRDEYGMCHPQGTWAHCMVSGGIVKIKHPRHPSGLLAVPVWNSWGNGNPSGNNRFTLQTGEEKLLPPGCFLVDLEVVDRRMLPARDSFALAGIGGWIPRPEEERKKLWLPQAA